MIAVARYSDGFNMGGTLTGAAAGCGIVRPNDDRLRLRPIMGFSTTQRGPIAPPLHLVLMHHDVAVFFGIELPKRLASVRVTHVPFRSAVFADQMSEGLLLQLLLLLLLPVMLLPLLLMAACQYRVIDVALAANFQVAVGSARYITWVGGTAS